MINVASARAKLASADCVVGVISAGDGVEEAGCVRERAKVWMPLAARRYFMAAAIALARCS